MQKLFVNIKSSVYPINVWVYDDCDNLIYNTHTLSEIKICVNSNSCKIKIVISYGNQKQIFKLVGKCVYLYFRPTNISVSPSAVLQNFVLVDLNYGLPIPNAQLYFAN